MRGVSGFPYFNSKLKVALDVICIQLSSLSNISSLMREKTIGTSLVVFFSFESSMQGIYKREEKDLVSSDKLIGV